MGCYREHVLPRIVNVACAAKTAEPLRRRVCAGLAGDVVELGFGSGLNVPCYPAAVTKVAAVEPSGVGWKLAAKRVEATGVPCSGPHLTPSRCRSPTTASTQRCPPGRCARSPTSPPRSGRSGGSSSLGARSTSSSTGSLRTSPCAAGNAASSRSRSACSGVATSPARSSTRLQRAGFSIAEVDVFYEKGAPRIMAADSLGIAVSP